MGRQVRFYMTPEDEKAFWDALFSIPSVIVLNPTSVSSEPQITDKHFVREAFHQKMLYLWNTMIPLSEDDVVRVERKRYDEQLGKFVNTGQVEYAISASSAPVIEYTRSQVGDNCITQGRIWADFQRLRNGSPESKGQTFAAWYESLAKWLRRNGKYIRLLRK